MVRLTLGLSCAVVTGLLLAACSFNSAGLPPGGVDGPGPGPDAPVVVDRGSGQDTDLVAASDGPPVDRPALDLPQQDQAAPLDLKPKPDLLPWPDLKPPPSCDDLYKAKTPGYYLCLQTATSCKFYFNGSSVSCASICDAACLKMEDNDPGSKCDPEQPMLCGSSACTCSSTLGDGQCTCAR